MTADFIVEDQILSYLEQYSTKEFCRKKKKKYFYPTDLSSLQTEPSKQVTVSASRLHPGENSKAAASKLLSYDIQLNYTFLCHT